jgi:hypothetical protein
LHLATPHGNEAVITGQFRKISPSRQVNIQNGAPTACCWCKRKDALLFAGVHGLLKDSPKPVVLLGMVVA